MRKFIDAVGEFIIIIALSLLLYVGIRHFVGFQFTVREILCSQLLLITNI